jgi:hypothetical protein
MGWDCSVPIVRRRLTWDLCRRKEVEVKRGEGEGRPVPPPVMAGEVDVAE